MIWEVETDVALLVCTLFTVIFVASCYALPRSIRVLNYGASKQVVARMVSTTVVSVCIVSSLLLLPYSDENDATSTTRSPDFLTWIGFRKEGSGVAILVSPLLVFLFFFGNIVLHILEWKTESPPICRVKMTAISSFEISSSLGLTSNFVEDHSLNVEHERENGSTYGDGTEHAGDFDSDAKEGSSWTATTARDYFIAPLTEELIFRSSMIPLLLSSGLDRVTTILLAPVFFSLSHIHLAYGDIKEGVSLHDIAINYSLQLFYTYTFGAFVSFIFIRTGHFVAVLIIHSLCNLNGLPKINIFSYNSPLIIKYRVLVALSYVAGFIAFGLALMPLTEPQLYASILFGLEISSSKDINSTR
mmetsp:Transcript_28723/g.35289  ORF Transcript_28723/g.35289 Transcript_28723/m.35289 type:complete len:359 (+) Transcript_28723:155-1231(+)